jgi:hypothetical protein
MKRRAATAVSKKQKEQKPEVKPSLVSILTSMSPQLSEACKYLSTLEQEYQQMTKSHAEHPGTKVKSDILKRMICSLTTQVIVSTIQSGQFEQLDTLIAQECCEVQEIIVVCAMFFTAQELRQVVQKTQTIKQQFESHLADWEQEAHNLQLPCIQKIVQESQNASKEAEEQLMKSLQSSLQHLSFDKVNEMLLKLKK